MNDKIQPEPEKKKRPNVQNEHNNDSDERKVKCPHCSKTFNAIWPWGGVGGH